MARRLKAWCVAVALLAGSVDASALTLQQAYERALQNDPTYRMAIQDRAAGRENRIIGRSALLPSVVGNYSANQVRADIDYGKDILGRDNIQHPKYISRSAVVQLRQPLFSMEAYARYKQGVAQSNYSEAVFDARTADVAVRVVGAYLEALYAEEQLRLIKAQRDMYAEQRTVNDRTFKAGEGTRTDMLETQARLDLAEAQVLEAQDQVLNSRNALAAIIGGEVDSLQGLGDSFRPRPLAPASFEAWRELALKNNPDLEAANFAIEAARQELNKARSGHIPRVDLIGSYSKNASETLNTLGQDSTQRAIGVQVNIPIYQGGYVNAVSRQASAGLEKARAELELRTDKVTNELRKEFNAAQTSMVKIEAYEKAVSSGELLVKATEQSIKGGVRINLDLLNARQQLFTSQRDLAMARYGYMIANLRLRAHAGTLMPGDVRDLGTYFR
jgi:protease secretion system outer membrane protein